MDSIVLKQLISYQISLFFKKFHEKLFYHSCIHSYALVVRESCTTIYISVCVIASASEFTIDSITFLCIRIVQVYCMKNHEVSDEPHLAEQEGTNGMPI